ncbi:MAG: zinc ribbon domain-containing protein [Methanobacteriota archaeon]|nr:MAG: zinc ribbon domain-containing protein [Euryarchaeota archaeon]
MQPPQPMYPTAAPAYVPPKKETAVPLLAGVFNLLGAIGWFAAAFFGLFFYLGLVCIIPGIFALLAAMFCFQRTNWEIALILSLLGGNILSLILVVISKDEFDWPKHAQPAYAYPQPYAYAPAPQYPQQYAQPQYPQYPQQQYQPPPAAPQYQPPVAMPPPAAPAQPTPAGRFCPNCGSPVAAGQTFCSRCGARVP